MMLRTIGLLACLATFTTAAQAAPEGAIDCAKAAAPDEKVICAEPRLIQDDAQMATLFQIAIDLVGMGTRGDMKDAQVEWLDRRHACKDDAACIRDLYGTRIAVLQKVIDAVKARGPL